MKMYKLLSVLARRIWSNSTIWLLKCPKGKLNIEPVLCPAEIRDITENNIEDCLAFDDVSYIKVYREMLSHGDCGQYGYLNGKCVFRRWTKVGGNEAAIRFAGQTIRILNSDDVYFHYSLTAPEARGHGIHSKALAMHAQQFKNYNRYTLILPTNSKSLIGFYRSGFIPIKEVTVRYRFMIPSIQMKDIEGFYDDKQREIFESLRT